MRKRRVLKGDKVRFLITSYYEMLKNEYTLPQLLTEASPENSEIVLGGEYVVLETRTNQWGIHMYKLLAVEGQRGWAPEGLVYPASQVVTCPYRLSDELCFRPKRNLDDIGPASVACGWDLMGIGARYMLRRIINSYYVNVDKVGASSSEFPLIWEDFARV